MLLRKLWGLGLGGEVIRCLLSQARSLGFRSLTARIQSGNLRSQQLLISAGFEIVGETTGYEIRPGVFRDCLRLECRLI
jgi:RimJ/RimL family protein N-acetyltransferase